MCGNEGINDETNSYKLLTYQTGKYTKGFVMATTDQEHGWMVSGPPCFWAHIVQLLPNKASYITNLGKGVFFLWKQEPSLVRLILIHLQHKPVSFAIYTSVHSVTVVLALTHPLTSSCSTWKKARYEGLLMRLAKQTKASAASIFSNRTAARNDIPCTCKHTAHKAQNSRKNTCLHALSNKHNGIICTHCIWVLLDTNISNIWPVTGIGSEYVVESLVIWPTLNKEK